MKTCLSLLLLAAIFPALAAMSLMTPDSKNFNVYGNTEWKKTTDEGRPAIHVKLGGINEQKGGAFQIMLSEPPQFPADEFPDGLSLLMRGDGDNGSVVVLLAMKDGTGWCWNGQRWESSAAISCAGDIPRKLVLKFSEFRKCGGPADKLDISLLKSVHIGIGPNLTSPAVKAAGFYLYGVLLEKGAAAIDELPSPATESGKSLKKSEAGAPPAQKGSLPVPPEWVNWSNEVQHGENTRIRRNLCLNNIWQFFPVRDSTVRKVIAAGGKLPLPPAALPGQSQAWYGKVPGRWDERGNFFLFDESRKPVDLLYGESRTEYMQGIYRRTVFIPGEWKGKRLFLDFDGVSERATLFVNGKPGSPFLKAGREDITERVRFGEYNDLAVFVEMTSLPVKPDHERFKEFSTPGMGARWWYGWRAGPGIPGDVWLRLVPGEVHADKLFVYTGVANQTITARAELRNDTDAEIAVRVAAEVCDETGTVLEIPGKTFTVPAGGTTEATLAGQWKNPVLWSPDHPKLYHLKLNVSGSDGKLLDEEKIRFGFREFSVGDDGFFRLNGTKIRLVFDSSQYPVDQLTDGELRRAFEELRKMNFNGLISESVDQRVYRLADEMGLMIAMRHVFPPLVRDGVYLPGVPNKGYPVGIYHSRKLAGAKAELENNVREIVEKFRNHPSLIIWTINPLLCYNSEWINPNRIDMERVANDIIRASLKEEAFLRQLDPSRPVMHSMGANTGSMIAVNPYPTFSNQPDEWADWPSLWASRKKKPLVLEEIAVPFCFNFANWHKASAGRDTGWEEKRQLFYETAARYFGDSAYDSCRNEMADALWHQRADQYVTEKDGVRHAPVNPMAAAVEKLWVERCFRAWRFYGVDGIWPFFGLNAYFSNAVSPLQDFPASDVAAPGSHPDRARLRSFDYPSPLRDNLRDAFAPFLACIGGRAEHFTSREHNYYAGERVAKTMLFSNDSQENAKVEATWEVAIPGSPPLASSHWNATLAPGEIRKIPFDWQAPDVTEKTRCRITLRTVANGKEFTDLFDVTVFPKHVKRDFSPVALYDETGATAAMLRKAGVPFTEKLSAETLAASGALLVGRDSFTEKFQALSRKWNLPELVENGLRVTVFSQGAASGAAEKLEERRTRAVFPKDPSHPVLSGAGKEDLSHWRGESRAVIPYPDPAAAVRNMRFMHWGTEGCVSSLLLDKPERGSFRVILDADFDLSRAALLELFPGKGRIVLCQLDLEDRYGIDPAATLLADNLFAYSSAPVPTAVPLAYAGPANGAESLRALGFNPKILSPEAALQLAESGGVAVIREDGAPQTEPVRLAKQPEFPAATRGLGNSDFYFNPAVRLPMVPFAVEKRGKGTVVTLRTLPEEIPAAYSRAKCRRAVATILTNLGARAATRANFGSVNGVGRIRIPETASFRIDPEEKGTAAKWSDRDFDDNDWRKLKLGAPWEAQGINMENPRMKTEKAYPYDGCAWYRFPVSIPVEMKGKPLFLEIDAIDDLDITWFNGVEVGRTREDTPNYWQFRRRYPLPPEVIAWGGKNVVAIQVTDLGGEGGILGAIRITNGESAAPQAVLYESSPRNILDFDPNSWRQW